MHRRLGSATPSQLANPRASFPPEKSSGIVIDIVGQAKGRSLSLLVNFRCDIKLYSLLVFSPRVTNEPVLAKCTKCKSISCHILLLSLGLRRFHINVAPTSYYIYIYIHIYSYVLLLLLQTYKMMCVGWCLPKINCADLIIIVIDTLNNSALFESTRGTLSQNWFW